MSLLERSAANGRPVVVQFHATWCGPCKALAPQVAGMETEFADQVDVWRVDVDQDPASAKEMEVRGVPTLVVLREGKEITRRSGFVAGEGLRNLFRAGLGEVSAVQVHQDNPTLDSLLRVGAGIGLQWVSGMSAAAHPLSWVGLGLLIWGMMGLCPSCRVPRAG